MKLATFGVLALVFLMCPNSTVQSRRYCGRQLADALSLLCSDGVYSPEQGSEKRSLAGSVPNWLLSQRSSGLEEYRSRQRRGIVDECCRKPCDVSTLLQYCA